MSSIINIILSIGFIKNTKYTYTYMNYRIIIGDYYELSKTIDINNYYHRRIILYKVTSITEFKHNIMKYFVKEIRTSNIKKILDI